MICDDKDNVPHLLLLPEDRPSNRLSGTSRYRNGTLDAIISDLGGVCFLRGSNRLTMTLAEIREQVCGGVSERHLWRLLRHLVDLGFLEVEKDASDPRLLHLRLLVLTRKGRLAGVVMESSCDGKAVRR